MAQVSPGLVFGSSFIWCLWWTMGCTKVLRGLLKLQAFVNVVVVVLLVLRLVLLVGAAVAAAAFL